jgi:hypothetical protein
MDALRPAPLSRLRPGHRIAIDSVIAVLLLFVSGGPADVTDLPRWAAALVVALAVLPAAARRRWPRTALALTAAKTHVGRLLMKLAARDRAQLVIAAYEGGLVGRG